MKKIAILILALLLLIQPAFGVTASIIKSGPQTTDLYFTGDSTSPKTWYQDAIDGNPDAGIEICGAGQKYVGATYAINVQGSWKYALVTYRSSSEALAYTDQAHGSDCYYTSLGYLTFSPSHLSTPNPEVYYAAFPGKVYVVYETSSNPGTLSNFVLASGSLLGDYSFSRSYDQGTNAVTVDTPTIIFQTPAGSVTKSASDSTFGINNERRMVVGFCTDEYGQDCYSGYLVPTEASFPLTLPTGLSPVDDQHTYQRYITINGMGKPICIGTNLQATINSVSPNPVYYSQNLTINFTVINKRDTPTEVKGGNVKVSTDFYVEIKIYRADNASDVVFDKEILISQDLPPNTQISESIIWPAYAKSGEYKVEVIADPENYIKECVETDNTDTQSFQLKPIILPQIWINGNKTNVFPFSGVPFNFTLYLKDSDDLNVSNATVRLIETNGISSFAPTQVWNASVNPTIVKKVGTKVINEVEFPTDYWGRASITIIPTGNPLYDPQYSYLGFKTIEGDYSLILTGKTFSGDDFVFVVNGNVTNVYPLKVEDYHSYQNFTYSSLPNLNNFVSMIMNTVYTIFAKFWKVVAS